MVAWPGEQRRAAPAPHPPVAGSTPPFPVAEDAVFERRSWQAQQIGCVLIGLTILGALAGLLGSGPLSRAVAGADPAALRVEYARFARASAPGVLRIHVPARAVADVFGVTVSRPYLDSVRVDAVTPPPLRVEARGDEVLYVFAGRPGSHGVAVTLNVTPSSAGILRARFGLPAKPPLAFWQLVYP
jgi:hypothetical protein